MCSNCFTSIAEPDHVIIDKINWRMLEANLHRSVRFHAIICKQSFDDVLRMGYECFFDIWDRRPNYGPEFFKFNHIIRSVFHSHDDLAFYETEMIDDGECERIRRLVLQDVTSEQDRKRRRYGFN